MFIYKLSNNFNNKIYIGQSRKDTLEERIYWYEKDIKIKKKPNEIIKVMREKGIENFFFEILEDNIQSQEELDERERYWISFYNSNNPEKGYNKDSGGISGGTKSKETKKLIGKTTKEKWNKEETALKMREGLRKGTQTVKEKAKENFVVWNCLNCGKEIKGKPYEAKTHKFCSTECFGEFNRKTGRAKENSLIASELKHAENLKFKEEIKIFIINWVKENKKLVLNCPYNKITSTLEPLFILLKQKYNLIDIRSYFLCFNAKNRKDFLNKLKEYC